MKTIASLKKALKHRLEVGEITNADSTDVRILIERAEACEDTPSVKHFLGAADAILQGY